MGRIMDDYLKMINEFECVIPEQLKGMLINEVANEKEGFFDIPSEEEGKYLVNGYEGLSEAVYALLRSGRGFYIVNYKHDFGVNRLSAGFNTAEELVHYAMWVVSQYSAKDPTEYKEMQEQKEKDLKLSNEEILKKALVKHKIKEELMEITFNMKGPEDFQKRLALIELMKECETVAGSIAELFSYYKIMDKIDMELNKIDNVESLNIAPKPIEQSEWEGSRVM